MGKSKLDETYVFKISIKNPILSMYLFIWKLRFLVFRLLLSRVAPYLHFATMNFDKR